MRIPPYQLLVTLSYVKRPGRVRKSIVFIGSDLLAK